MDLELERLVWLRARGVCEYCRMVPEFDPLPFCIDHIIAQKHHGATTEDNLALACYNCNSHKGPNIAGIDPETKQLAPLFNPRADVWQEHFQWNGAVLIGRTPVGRATVDVSVAVKNGTRMAAKDGTKWVGPITPCIASRDLRSGSTKGGRPLRLRPRFSPQKRRARAEARAKAKGATRTLLKDNNASVCGTAACTPAEVYQLAAEVARFFTGTDIDVLGINRQDRIEHRRLLIAEGVFPRST